MNFNIKDHLSKFSKKFSSSFRILRGDLVIDFTLYICCSDLTLIPPTCEGLAPTSWWDPDADKSLLVGTFKHGFERYNMMRLDPALCFLTKCGPPDNAAVQVRIQKTETLLVISS